MQNRRYLRWCVSPGHNLSQEDATSLEGEAPAITGCYKQYEHAITNKMPQSTDPSQVRDTTNGPGASTTFLTVSS